MNRETKRLLKKQGQLSEEGEYAPKVPSSAQNLRRYVKAEPSEKKKTIFEKVITFIKESIGELKKVYWPTRQEVINYSILVFVSLLLVGALVFVLNLGADKLILFLFKK